MECRIMQGYATRKLLKSNEIKRDGREVPRGCHTQGGRSGRGAVLQPGRGSFAFKPHPQLQNNELAKQV